VSAAVLIGPRLRCGEFYSRRCVAAGIGYACWGSSACGREYKVINVCSGLP
jgi:hypothetical protein